MDVIPTPHKGTDRVTAMLRSLWRRQRLHAHLRGGVMLGLTVAFLAVVALTLDLLIRLPAETRVLLLVGCVATAGWMLYRWWWSGLHAYDPRRLALQVESHYDHLDSALIAYLQLSDRADGSATLIAAARANATAQAQGLATARLVSFRDLRRPAAYLAIAWLMIVLAALIWPQTAAAFVARMLNPFGDRAYPTRTQLVLQQNQYWAPRGGSVLLSAAVEGVTPATASIEIREAEARHWETLRLEVDEHGRLTHRLAPLDGDLIFRFRGGDGVSAQGGVNVVTSPRVRSAVVTVDYPSYTAVGQVQQDQLNVRGPVGSTVRWHLELDRPVAAAEWVQLDEDEGVVRASPFELHDQGLAVQASSPLQTLVYRLRWTVDVPGLDEPMVFDDPVRYRLESVPDAPPSIHLLQPSERSLIATPRLKLPIAFRASDDFGLTEAWIVYRLRDDPTEHRVSVGKISGRSVNRHEYLWDLSETVEGLSPQQSIEFTIEVADNRDQRGGRLRTRSEPWHSVLILSDEEFLRFLADRQVEALEQVTQVRDQSGESLEQVQQLHREAPDPASPSDTESQP